MFVDQSPTLLNFFFWDGFLELTGKKDFFDELSFFFFFFFFLLIMILGDRKKRKRKETERPLQT